MVKTTTLAIILAALVISVVFAEEADAAGLVKRAISTVGTWAVSDIPQLPATKIDLADGNIIVGSGTTGLSVDPSGDVDISNTGAFSIPNIHNINNVTSTGCAAGQILKVSGTTWQCAADSGLASINGDTTATQTIVGITGNTTISTTGGATTINLGTNVVTTGDSAQTITKGLTINSGTLGGPLNIAGNTFTNTGTITFPTVTGTLATLAGTETLSGKTLTTPQINGLDLGIVKKTGAYTLTSTDDVIYADATSGAFTLTLPTAGSMPGKVFTIIKNDTALTNIVTLDAAGSETISDMLLWNFTQREQSLTIQSNGGSEWDVTSYTPFDRAAYAPKGATLNRYISTPTDGTTLVTGTLAVDVAYAMPFPVSKVMTFDQIAIRPTTGCVAGTGTAVIRLSVYSDNGNMYPGTLIADAGTVACTGTATVTAAFTQTLQPGLYWLVATSNAQGTAAVVRSIAVAGMPVFLGLDSAFGTTPGFGWSVAQDAGVAAPSPFTPGGTIITALPLPYIGLRTTG